MLLFFRKFRKTLLQIPFPRSVLTKFKSVFSFERFYFRKELSKQILENFRLLPKYIYILISFQDRDFLF